MKRLLAVFCVFVLVCIPFLTGCSDSTPSTYQDEHEAVEKVGDIDDAFRNVIENNVFNGIVAFDGRLLKAKICSADDENKTVVWQIQMMDEYGNDLAAYELSSDDAYNITTLEATDDGGFLFVLGFQDYAYDLDTWASDKGFASRVIKCDSNGNLQFDTSFDGIEGQALEYCFEKNGRFYFFGTIQTPETKRRGVYSTTDVFMTVMDKNGNILMTRCIAGSDYDQLDAAEICGDSFVLSVSSQSDDGDFAGSDSKGYRVCWVITVNNDFEITEKKKETGRDSFDYRLGEKDGVPMYRSDSLLDNFDAGTPEAFIAYDNFYLIVSRNITGEYENTPPMLSSIWYYTETVYSAYDYNGELIFRDSVDSSPDFDALIEAFYNK